MSQPEPSKTKKAIIFGAGEFAEVVHFYLTHDSEYEVVAFTATNIEGGTTFCGLPVVNFSEVEKQYPPADYEMYIAVGYRKMNDLRQQFYDEAKLKGYRMLSYVCSKASTWPDLDIGDNVFIFEDNTIQPFVSIGDNVVLWSGNHIGHHSKIKDHVFISSHVVISGHCNIGESTFIGVNATLADGITLGKANLIGSGVTIQKSTQDDEVYLLPRIKPFPKNSRSFFS